MKEQNAFFSGSYKQHSTWSVRYPANVHADASGKNFDPNNKKSRKFISLDMNYYVKGVIDPKEYEGILI